MKKSLILMACVSVLALALAACHRESGFSAGEEMNADELRAYREKLLAENAVEPTPEEEDLIEELPDVCYYVEKGSVWHASKSCSSLKKSENSIESDLEGAELAGKARPCSKCASKWQ
jgi:hypothetical protein